MSKLVGDRLPEEVVRAFDGTGLDHKIGPAHILVTMDPDGTPRPCMLSAGEILALDDRRLRLALWPGSGTGANLTRGGAALLCYVTPGTVLYVRGKARALPERNGPGMEAFEIGVSSVETDAHPGLPVIGGLTFGVDGIAPERLTERWHGQLEMLREP